MRISATVFVILLSACIINASVLDPVIENVVHLKATKPPGEVGGIWKKKTIWKPRWVKDWKSAKVMKPVWRKVWSPIQIREWLPIPKPPPGWDASTPLSLVYPKPQKAHLKDSQGHDSFPVQSATTLPLWDPVPYPESQQPPPPPPFPQPLQNTDCSKGGCDTYQAHTFNHQQILEILGPRYQQSPDYFQNPEYSETVNHQMRLPPETHNWRPPQPLPEIQFRPLPEFLTPPKSENTRFQTPDSNNPPQLQTIPPWIPLPPENKLKGQLVTRPPDQPYKFESPEPRKAHNQTKPNPDDFKVQQLNLQTQNISVHRPHADGDFIQEAQLVGEYHYSEFDLNIKQEPNKQQGFQEEKVRVQPQRVKSVEHQRPVVYQQLVVNKNKPQPPQKDIKPQQQVQRLVTNQNPLVDNKPKPTQKDTKQQQHQRPAVNLQPVTDSKTKAIQKDIKQQNVRRPTANHQPVFDNKPNPIEKDTKQVEIHSHLSNSHIQKKHIQPSSKSSTNFQQQEALIKEIFPVFKTSQTNLNQTHPSNHRFELPTNNNHLKNSTLLLPVSLQSNLTSFQQQKEEFPNYGKPQVANSNSFPPDHTFFFASEGKQQEKPILSSDNSTKLTTSKVPTFDKENTVQLIFATAPDEQNQEVPHKSTTTERYEVIFSSSLLATTQSVTKSPLIIVTPVSSQSDLNTS